MKPPSGTLRWGTGGSQARFRCVVDDTGVTKVQSATQQVRPEASPIRVLVVDDEPSLGELLSMAFRHEKFAVNRVATSAEAVRRANDFRPDIVVLDMMLPDLDGLDGLRRLRADLPDVPVVFVTAKNAIDDRVAVHLNAGGDDYVTKPFGIEEIKELVARVRALLRRSGCPLERGDNQLMVGDLVLDEDSHEVWRGDDAITLSATEFELLRYLMRNPRRVLSRAQILDRVWSYDFGGQANVVETYVSYLRRKIDAGRDPMIHTVRGFGYVLKPAAT